MEKVSLNLQNHAAVETLRYEARLGQAIKKLKTMNLFVNCPGGETIMNLVMENPELAGELLQNRLKELEATQAVTV